MNQWDEAARGAAKELAEGTADPRTYEEMYSDHIARHFAQLRSTYEKMVELLKEIHDDTELSIGSERKITEILREIGELE